MKLQLKANAKINLTLDITGVLSDGYHAISTVMQSVSLCDRVELNTDVSEGITLYCTEKNVPCDCSNTAYKAAELFYTAAGIKPSVAISIQKAVPYEAGLAGGSADAAAVLYGLNKIYDYPLLQQQMLDAALKVGADVPFCITGGTRLCVNKGEKMTELPFFKSYIVIAKPEQSVSTAQAFSRFDSAQKLCHPNNDSFIFNASKGDYTAALNSASNIFEQLTDIPCGEKIKEAMKKHGAVFASLSGSGSAYFGVFFNNEDAVLCANVLKSNLPFVCVCNTAKSGIEETD